MSFTERDLDKIESLLFAEVLAARELYPITILPWHDGDSRVSELERSAHEEFKTVVAGAKLSDTGFRKVTVYGHRRLIHFSEVSMKEARLYGVKWFPRLHFMSLAELGDDLKLRDLVQMFTFPRGERWMELANLRDPVPTDIPREPYKLSLLMSLVRRYQWTVRLSVDDGPVVEFLTTSEHAREIFRWREKPPELSRRPALRHWVSRLRRKPSKGRQPWYLRGATDFTWQGIKCKLLPSSFEREAEISRAAEPK